MKIKLKQGVYPIAADGKYTGKHYSAVSKDTLYFCIDADLVLPGFAKISENNQETYIQLSRADYVSFDEDPIWWRDWAGK